MIKALSLFINLLVLVVGNVQEKVELEDKPTYLFLYGGGGLDPRIVSIIIDIPLAEILLSEYTIAVEARGWVRKYVGRKQNNNFLLVTMRKSEYRDEMFDAVEGVAVRLKMS